MAFENN
jgi:hypothetical protein